MIRRFLCLSLLLIVGCGPADEAENLPPPPKDRYRIAVIPKGLTHEHWKSVERGALRAARDFSAENRPIEIVWDGPRRENDDQIKIVEQNMQLGLNGIVLAPQHSKLMVRAVKRAAGHGLGVVIIDSDLDRRDLYDKYVATNNYNGGVIAARHLLRRLEKKGVTAPRLILFRYAPGSESTEQREQGFLDELEKQRQAGKSITLLADDVHAGATIDTAEKAATPLLARERDNGIDGIFAVNESAATGMLLALRAQPGVKERALLMGFDASKPILKALREGEVIGLVVQNPYQMGYLSVWTMLQHLDGYDVNDGGKSKYLSTGEFVLTGEFEDADDKVTFHVDSDAARRLYDPERQPEQRIELPTLMKRK